MEGMLYIYLFVYTTFLNNTLGCGSHTEHEAVFVLISRVEKKGRSFLFVCCLAYGSVTKTFLFLVDVKAIGLSFCITAR